MISFGSHEFMNDAEIVFNVRQLACALRNQTATEALASEAYKSLASTPGRGGALMQWFNRETRQSRKRILSNMLGLIARASYQQTPEFLSTTASELELLCDRIEQADAVAPPLAQKETAKKEVTKKATAKKETTQED